MFLQKKITIDRPIEIVWSYFINPNNWRNWYVKGIRQVGNEWSEGALVMFTDGSGSRILEFKEKETLQLETRGSYETWYFAEIGKGKTKLSFESKFDSNVRVNEDDWNQGVDRMLSNIKDEVEAS